jgi:polyisoprenoid-binding protein YceI
MIRRLTIAVLLALPMSAFAAGWTADPASSTLQFIGESQGEAFTGRFERFTPTIAFDPAALANSRFDVAIDVASANTDNAERDAQLVDPAFFDPEQHPQARYLATRFEALDGGRFRALGELTLRGVTRPVALEFSWSQGADGARLVGDAVLNRLDFGVGTGDWEDPEAIALDVKVHTELALQPK